MPAESLDIPVVDLSAWWAGSESARRAVAADLDAAASSLGFMQVSGHGIDPELIHAMASVSSAFFDQPIEAKMAVRPADVGANRGYAPPQSEALANSLGEDATPDLFEAFNIGEVDVDRDDPFVSGEGARFFAPNVWPPDPTFRGTLTGYFRAARGLAVTLTDVFALALGLEERWFRPFVERSTTTMRVINYTAEMCADAPADAIGMGAHSDYGVVTVLWADGQPGLQVLDPSGAWRDVAPAPDNLLVNLGDLTATWTNDRWRSTLHRVLPPSIVGIERRQSAAFFLDGNWNATVECLPTCTSPDNPPRYPPVTAGEHLLAKLMGPRELRPSIATGTTGDRLVD